MRWLHLTVVVVFLAALVIFIAQNAGAASVAFLGWSLTAPIALVVFVAYALGAATGGSLFALLRRSVKGSRAGP